jgi:hypothetical protein
MVAKLMRLMMMTKTLKRIKEHKNMMTLIGFPN